MEIAAGLRFTVDLHGADDRRPATTIGMFRFGSCSVDVATRPVVREAVDNTFEPQAFDLLAYLLAYRDRVITTTERFDEVWGSARSATWAIEHATEVLSRIGNATDEQTAYLTSQGRHRRILGETGLFTPVDPIFSQPRRQTYRTAGRDRRPDAFGDDGVRPLLRAVFIQRANESSATADGSVERRIGRPEAAVLSHAMATPEAPVSPVALVTGASSGIGAATVRRLTADGYHVTAVARREERLDALSAATGCDTHTLDVRDSDALIDLIRRTGPIDVLINNAGLGRMNGSLAQLTLDDVTRSVDTNVTAVMVATMAALPGMTERGRGHVVNIGSMAGLYPLQSAVYGATKGAIHRLSTNLRLELRGTGVRVTEICPGRVSTEFYDVAIDDPERRRTVKETGVDEVTADEVADAIAYALGVPPHVNINRIELQPTAQSYGGSQFDTPTADRSETP